MLASDKTSNRRRSYLLLLLFSVLAVLIIGRYFNNLRIYNARKMSSDNAVAVAFEDSDIMNQDDYYRVIGINKSIKSTNMVSDTDLDWWIKFVTRPKTSKQNETSASVSRLVALDENWYYLTKPTPQQKDRLFDLAKSYLNSPKEDNEFFGCILIMSLNEKRAAPILKLHRNSPYPSIRELAVNLLKKWNL